MEDMSYKELKGLMSELQIEGRSKLTTKEAMVEAISLQDLPIEMMEMIALQGPKTWAAMTSVPEFGRYSVNNQKRAIAKFKSVDSDGDTYLDGKWHSFRDEPAVVIKGDKFWYKNGLQHRDGDKPAVIIKRGAEAWLKNGKFHRDDDKPAVVSTDEKRWHREGRLHRDGDKPAVIKANGDMEWYQNDKLHRDGDQPAVIEEHGDMVWYQNGVEVSRKVHDKFAEMEARLFASDFFDDDTA